MFKLPDINISSTSTMKSAIAGITIIYATTFAAIIVLILNKDHFSDDLFLKTLYAFMLSGAGATIYLFCYGIAERTVKSVDKIQQEAIKLKEKTIARIDSEKR